MHLNVTSRDAISNYNYSKGYTHGCVTHSLLSVIWNKVQANQERLELQGTYNLLVCTIINLLDKNMHGMGSDTSRDNGAYINTQIVYMNVTLIYAKKSWISWWKFWAARLPSCVSWWHDLCNDMFRINKCWNLFHTRIKCLCVCEISHVFLVCCVNFSIKCGFQQ
jgi:hypothetical protein